MIKTFTFSLLSVLAIFNAKAQELKTIDEIHTAYKNNSINAQQLTQSFHGALTPQGSLCLPGVSWKSLGAQGLGVFGVPIHTQHFYTWPEAILGVSP